MTNTSGKTITAEEFDAKFDAGEDILEYLDLESARVVAPEQRAEPQTASLARLQRALEITEQIQRLEKELISVLESEMSAAASAPAARLATDLP